jgi:uncharacterized repeat protein (TIGR03806 family)
MRRSLKSLILVPLLSFGLACAPQDTTTERGLTQRVLSGDLDQLSETVATDRTTMPQKLSETGLFTQLSTLAAAPGFIPYGVQFPFWSDYAQKSRWVYVADGRITINEDHSWNLPVGSILLKHFELPMPEDSQTSTTRIETRVLLKLESGWDAFTYEWNDQQSDATLVAASGAERDITTVNSAGEPQTVTWNFPRRSECLECHNTAAGPALGFRTRQLNHVSTYNGLVQNQIVAWNRLNMFAKDLTPKLANLPQFPQWPADNSSASLNERARAYLAVNCGICHYPDNDNKAQINLRLDSDLAAAIGQPPLLGSGELENAKIIQPGSPESSMLWVRMSATNYLHMPAISSSQADTQGVELISEWIRDEL